MLSEWNIEKHSAYWMHKYKRCVYTERQKRTKEEDDEIKKSMKKMLSHKYVNICNDKRCIQSSSAILAWWKLSRIENTFCRQPQIETIHKWME